MTSTQVVVVPEGATVPTGETDTPGGEMPDGGPELAPAPGPDKGPVEKPAATTNITVNKTTVSKLAKPKAATAKLPKTVDSHWVTLSSAFFLLGTALIVMTRRCRDIQFPGVRGK